MEPTPATVELSHLFMEAVCIGVALAITLILVSLRRGQMPTLYIFFGALLAVCAAVFYLTLKIEPTLGSAFTETERHSIAAIIGCLGVAVVGVFLLIYDDHNPTPHRRID
jgi:drug/metabolite transporter (DMT)-like permease